MRYDPLFKKGYIVLKSGRLLGFPPLNRDQGSVRNGVRHTVKRWSILSYRPSNICVHCDSLACLEQMSLCIVTCKAKPLVMEGLNCQA
ncbi:hypothetical protein I79_007622 [Cricetulus griseus]|uniref:Uncharacterized protein n=1 Tax=Cricetulus griseus TaxID=10029 RepID=G3HB09_CRIGR|nr:hypothetical protein I79_007622 [Cricetulus griseus]